MSDLLMTRLTAVRPAADRTGARRLKSMLRMAFRAYLTRQGLPELTRRELADIGVSPSAAVAEAARLPWDINPEPRGHRTGIIGAVQNSLERARSRHLISRMSTRELRDIGLSPTNAQTEATKFFWQA
jgi:uncharacterized protein YjiS (DUF1127 family)